MHPRLGSVLFGAVLAPWLAAAHLLAGGVVGDGTPQSCTEAALVARLAGGGTVTFNCGGPVVIPVTSAKRLTATTAVDGTGQQVTLDGGGTTRLFQTTFGFSPITLTFRNLTLRNGRAPDFGGAIRLAYQDPANWTTLNPFWDSYRPHAAHRRSRYGEPI